MPPLVSIIIPCYNASKWIGEAIESALDQSWPSKEIIVVDDGSTDGSLDIIQKYRTSEVKIMSQSHTSASRARNRALKEAAGEYIQYLDADDLLSKSKIEIQIQKLTEAGPDYVASGPWGYFERTTEQTKFVYGKHWRDSTPIEFLIEIWGNGRWFPPLCWLIPRKIAEQAGPWDETLSHSDDTEYACRILLASKGIKFCEQAKSYYRKNHGETLSTLNSKEKILSRKKAIDLCVNRLLQVENSDRTKRASAAWYQAFVYMAYPRMPQIWKAAEIEAKILSGSKKPPISAIHPIAQLAIHFLGLKLTRLIQYIFLFLLFVLTKKRNLFLAEQWSSEKIKSDIQ